MSKVLPRFAAPFLTSLAMLSVGHLAMAATAGACFPECRSGYTCHESQCISLCNPACDAGEICTAAGTCEVRSVAPAAPPAPVVATTPAASATPLATPTPAPVAAPSAIDIPVAELRGAEAHAGTFVLRLQLGLEVVGGGKAGLCGSTGSSCTPSNEAGFKDESRASLGVAGLFHVSRRLRLGLGYTLIPYSAMSYDDDESSKSWHQGSEHSLRAIFEGLLPVAARSSLVGSFFGGPDLLVVGGDLSDANEDFIAGCEDAGVHCDSSDGPFLGYSYGTSFGFMTGKSPRWRFDLAVERFGYQTFEYRAGSGDGAYRSEETLSGARIGSWPGLSCSAQARAKSGAPAPRCAESFSRRDRDGGGACLP